MSINLKKNVGEKGEKRNCSEFPLDRYFADTREY